MGPILFFAMVLAACGGLAWLLAVTLYARRLLAPPRLTDGKALYRLGRVSPADLGWPFESLAWPSADGLTLRGWRIPPEAGAPDAPVAVLVHGYADAKVGALAWTPLFRELGCDLVLPDLRGHGESEGRHITAGWREADDLARLLDDLALRRPGRRFVLFGASLGTAAVVRVAAFRDDVAALVLDSPVPHFLDGALAHAGLLAVAGPSVVRPAVALAGWWTRVRWSDVAVEHTLPLANAAALLILAQDDPFLPPARRNRLARAAESLARRYPATRVLQPPGRHLTALATDPPGYATAVADFLRLASALPSHATRPATAHSAASPNRAS